MNLNAIESTEQETTPHSKTAGGLWCTGVGLAVNQELSCEIAYPVGRLENGLLRCDCTIQPALSSTLGQFWKDSTILGDRMGLVVN